jgi:ribosomal protein S18 acetylase RimI-like enzyme
VLKYKYVNLSDVPKEIILGAMADPYVKDGFCMSDSKKILIIYNNKEVGVFAPYTDVDGYFRFMCLYILPDYRGIGIASNTIKHFVRGVKSKVRLHVDNASAAWAFVNAGFVVEETEENKSTYTWYKEV